VSQFARYLGGSTVGPQKNPKVLFPGQKSGSERLFLFRPKWTNGARADFWAYSGGFFLSLAKKWVDFWKIFEKSQKCRAKKNIFSRTRAAGYVIRTSIELQHFFSQEYFFPMESWKKYFLTPLTSLGNMFAAPLIRRAKRA
jgi:hypothetical protein